MKTLLLVSRILVGILFIFSGLIKANDPLGLSYKMQEFFEVWGLHSLNNFTLVFSIVMISFEIIAGVAVLLGWKMNLFSWLLLLLIVFFTFLTGYALFSGKIKECGCFGDCIPIQAQQSFLKDIILLLLIIFIFIYRHRIKPVFNFRLSLLLLFFTAVLTFSFQWYVLQHLPLVDCLPYRIGNNIPEKMKIPAGAIPDSTVITFVYETKGKEIEFTADKFPDDFNDSGYRFIKRYDKVIRKGNAEPAIKDFSLTTLSNTDTTQAILSNQGYTLLLFARTIDVLPNLWYWRNEYFSAIQVRADEKNIPMYLVTANAAKAIEGFRNANLAGIDILTADATAIKTAARVNPTLFLIKNGVIIDKWGYVDFQEALRKIERMNVTQ